MSVHVLDTADATERGLKAGGLAISLAAHGAIVAAMLVVTVAPQLPEMRSTPVMRVSLIERPVPAVAVEPPPPLPPRPEVARPEPPRPVAKPELPRPVTKPELPRPVTKPEPIVERPAPPEPVAEPSPPVEVPVVEEVPMAEAPATAEPSPEQTVVAPSFDADYLHNPHPVYPRVSRRLGEEGSVALKVRVSRDGRPAEVRIDRSSGSPRLDHAAVDAVRRWQFVPARRVGMAVEGWVIVPIQFKLES